MSTTFTVPSLRKPRRIRWALVIVYPVWLMAVWTDRVRKRRELAGLEDFQLLDAGIDPDFVRAEVRKPFWRA